MAGVRDDGLTRWTLSAPLNSFTRNETLRILSIGWVVETGCLMVSGVAIDPAAPLATHQQETALANIVRRDDISFWHGKRLA